MQTTGVRVLRDFHNHKKPEFEEDLYAETEPLPEWVLIYFAKTAELQYDCSLCHSIITTRGKPSALLKHLQDMHKEINDLHKGNQIQENVGFHIEYLELNANNEAELKSHPVILGEICEEVSQTDKNYLKEIIVKTKKKKMPKRAALDDSSEVIIGAKDVDHSNRKRSWVWKYFNQMSPIIFQCCLCNAVLSIKGCNTNNMNRHVRSRHPTIYTMEMQNKSAESELDMTEDTPVAVKLEELSASTKELDDSFGNRLHAESYSRQRRSWIWIYFDRTSATTAQCKLCRRQISHGGNATGNMNRHLKMIHHKTAIDYSWIWKVFDATNEDFYSCKICQYRCSKDADHDKNISCIVEHLKDEHAVVSGDQIITSTEDIE